VISEDQTVQVRIIRIDPSRKRLGLSLRLDGDQRTEETAESSESDSGHDETVQPSDTPETDETTHGEATDAS
jgi:ribosomal protein S1